MFERFTERARQVIVLAQQEARGLNNHEIGGPHILLGLVAEEEGVGSRALTDCGVELEPAREAIRKHFPGMPGPAEGKIPFTPNAREILEGTLREALGLGHNFIGTEHLLLGLLAKEDGSCTAVLREIGADPERISDRVFELLGVDDPRRRSRLRSAIRRRADVFNRAAEGPGRESPGDGTLEEEDEAIEAIEAIPTHQDRPATEDELGRARLAEVLGERIRRVRGENTEAPAQAGGIDGRSARPTSSPVAAPGASWCTSMPRGAPGSPPCSIFSPPT